MERLRVGPGRGGLEEADLVSRVIMVGRDFVVGTIDTDVRGDLAVGVGKLVNRGQDTIDTDLLNVGDGPLVLVELLLDGLALDKGDMVVSGATLVAVAWGCVWHR